MPRESAPDLAESQARFITVIQQGPPAFPEGLFTGSSRRALLGLKAHANTISHARLVALEETYPRTLARMGLEQFNGLSRAFIEQPDTRTRNLMLIGAEFSAFLAASGCDPLTVQLARIEWLWLESYHAADARALLLADLSGLDEHGLLDLPLVLHPACRWTDASDVILRELPELANNNAGAHVTTVLITRPHAAVLLHALDEDRAAIFDILVGAERMRNLLAGAIERLGEARALPSIFALIEAGVLAAHEA